MASKRITISVVVTAEERERIRSVAFQNKSSITNMIRSLFGLKPLAMGRPKRGPAKKFKGLRTFLLTWKAS